MFDIRGKYPEEINEILATKIGKVFYNFCGGGSILVARDGRKSSKGLSEAVRKCIPEIIDIGQSSTPLFAYSVIKSGACGGIMVTASHLSANYNGFKFVKKNAEPLTEKEVEEIGLVAKKQKKAIKTVGVETERNSYVNGYIEEIKKKILKKYPLKSFNIEVKSSNKEIVKVWRKIWPYKLNTSLAVDYLFVWDADGDRLTVCDSTGAVIPNDFVIAAIIRLLLRNNSDKEVVIENRLGFPVLEAIEREMGKLTVVPAWVQNLKFAMIDNQKIILGAEASGHCLRQDFYRIDDGIVEAITFLQVISDEKIKKKFDKYFEEYLILPEENLYLKQVTGVLEKLADYFQEQLECQVSLMDGLTVQAVNWRFNLRYSLTENKLRMNFQARQGGVKGRSMTEMAKVLQKTNDKDYNFYNNNNYYMIRGNPSITVLKPGLIAEEFNKTFGHFHIGNQAEIYQVIFGKGLMMLQNRANEVKIIKIKTGDKVEIPVGWAHTLINTGRTHLITADNSFGEQMNDYSPIAKKRGFYYYVIKDKNKIKFSKNPAYGK